LAPPDEDPALLDRINAELILAGVCPPPPDWSEVLGQAREKQKQIEAEWRAQAQQEAAEQAVHDAEQAAYWEDIAEREAAIQEMEMEVKRRIGRLMDVPTGEVPMDAVDCVLSTSIEMSDEDIRKLWAEKPWERAHNDAEDWCVDLRRASDTVEPGVPAVSGRDDLSLYNLTDEERAQIRPGETRWSIERNAAAAGFDGMAEYLRWRATETAN